MIKDIYILWFQGFNNAPVIVKDCLFSWKHYNPHWNVIELDNSNLDKYVDISEYRHINLTALSDIVRVFILNKFGGLWVDATTFCNKPLDSWLQLYINEGFFTFSWTDKSIYHKITSWFIYSEKNIYLIRELESAVIKYFKDYNKPQQYFWLHRLFGIKYMSDEQFKMIYDKVPSINASPGPHTFANKALNRVLTLEEKMLIDSDSIPFYKLSYKVQIKTKKPKLIFNYITESINRKTANLIEAEELRLKEKLQAVETRKTNIFSK